MEQMVIQGLFAGSVGLRDPKTTIVDSNTQEKEVANEDTRNGIPRTTDSSDTRYCNNNHRNCGCGVKQQ